MESLIYFFNEKRDNENETNYKKSKINKYKMKSN